MKNNEKYKNTFYIRQHGDSQYFNFDISPLIKNFSFIDFMRVNNKQEHNGILLITDNQYILGYTASFGIGTHRLAMARIMKDITGGGKIASLKDTVILEHNCNKTMITARIVYNYIGDNKNGYPIYSGAIYFKLPKENTITINQFEIFKQFYEDYNHELELIIRNYGLNKFNIQYECIDEFETKIVKKTDNLKDVYEYYKSCIDINKKINIDNEVILGITKKDNKHKIKIKKPNN